MYLEKYIYIFTQVGRFGSIIISTIVILFK